MIAILRVLGCGPRNTFVSHPPRCIAPAVEFISKATAVTITASPTHHFLSVYQCLGDPNAGMAEVTNNVSTISVLRIPAYPAEWLADRHASTQLVQQRTSLL